MKIIHDWEFQATRTGTNSVQSATGNRRTGSVASYAATVSNGAGANQDDSSGANQNTLVPEADGSHYFEGGTDQGFIAALYDQAVTVSAGRHMPNWDCAIVPTSLRTDVSNELKDVQSQNRYNIDAGGRKVVAGVDMYANDFSSFEIKDSWIMDVNSSGDSIYIVAKETLMRPTLHELGPNNEVYAQSDGYLDEYVMESGFRPRNQSHIIHIRNLSLTATDATGPRPAGDVNRGSLSK